LFEEGETKKSKVPIEVKREGRLVSELEGAWGRDVQLKITHSVF